MPIVFQWLMHIGKFGGDSKILLNWRPMTSMLHLRFLMAVNNVCVCVCVCVLTWGMDGLLFLVVLGPEIHLLGSVSVHYRRSHDQS